MSGYIEYVSSQIADILMREGLDYTQTKAVLGYWPDSRVNAR